MRRLSNLLLSSHQLKVRSLPDHLRVFHYSFPSGNQPSISGDQRKQILLREEPGRSFSGPALCGTGLKPHVEALEYVEFFGFAPLTRSLCEGGMRGRIFRAKRLGKSCVKEAYLPDQILACMSGCRARQRSANCPHSQGRVQPFCVRLFVHWFIHSGTSSIISHGQQMRVGPLVLAHCQVGGRFPGDSLRLLTQEAPPFHLRRRFCLFAGNAFPEGS